MTTQTKDSAVEQMAERITKTFDETLAALIERRDAAYEAAIAPLNAEIESLDSESAQIEERGQDFIKRMASAQRMKQFEADQLLIQGKDREAQAKLAELEEAKAAPAQIEQRRQEIEGRIADLEAEKNEIRKRIFWEWYGECQEVIRAAEKGFFFTLVDGIFESLSKFDPKQAQNANVRFYLTSPARSQIGDAATRWYG
jgi:DNA repair exonuclease SbcCD ATPase subunit